MEAHNLQRLDIPCVAVRNDRPHVVQVGSLRSLFLGHLPPCIEVLSVMELLCLEQSLDLVRYSVVWVVTKVSGDFVRGGQNGRASPS